jgi:HlyD family secretion protein
MDKPRDPKHKQQRRLRRIAGWGAIGIGLLAVTWWLSQLGPAVYAVDEAVVVKATVGRGEMLRQVRGPGTLVAVDQRWIVAETNGRVEEIVELAGAQVTADTVVLRLSNPELEQQAQDAILDLRKADAEMIDLRVSLESAMLSQQAEAARVRAEYEEAKLVATADAELSRDGLTPDISAQRSRLRADQLASRNEIEQQRLSKMSESISAQLDSRGVSLEQLQAIAALRRSQVAALTVRAGIDGVLQEVPLEVGQRVSAGSNLALVADPSQLKAELQIPQVQARDLAFGQPVEIDTRNGMVEGQVQRIDPAVREGTVTVDVSLPSELPKGARPDLSVQGTVEIERLVDVLYVRRPASTQPDSTTQLYKLVPGGEAVRVPVELGRGSVDTMEVLSGLEEGDVVIVSDSSAWENHDRIRLK